MPRFMDKADWIQTVADVSAAENVWYENIVGNADNVSFSLPERGRYRVILVKLEGTRNPQSTSPGHRKRKISPKVRALRGAAKQQKSFSFELTPEWKTYTAEVDKAATPIDRVMFKFFVSKDSVADFDDCVVTPVG